MFLRRKKPTRIRIAINETKLNAVIFRNSLCLTQSLKVNSSLSVHNASRTVKSITLTVTIIRYLSDFLNIMNVSKKSV